MLLQALNPALGYYLSAHAEVSPATRGILINWLIEVSAIFFPFPIQLDSFPTQSISSPCGIPYLNIA